MTTLTQSTLTGIRYRTDREAWEARVCLQGKNISKRFPSMEEAISWRKKMQEPKVSETLLTCADLLPKWLESLRNDPEFSPQTCVTYSVDAKGYFIPFFGKVKIKDVTDELLVKFTIYLKDVRHRQKPLSSKTIKNIIGSLSNFLEYCTIRDYIEFSPARSPLFKSKLSQLVKTRSQLKLNIKDKARSFDELNMLISACYNKSFELGLSVEFILSTAMRIGEAAALTWADLQHSAHSNGGQATYFITINKTRYHVTRKVQNKAKSGSNGLIPISSSLAEKMNTWKILAEKIGYDVSPSDSLLPKIAQGQRNLTETLIALSRRIGIRKTTAHCLRHSSVTFLATNGHDLQQVQKFARHSSVNMTRAYFEASYLGLESMAQTMQKFSFQGVPTCSKG
ncbi:MAG: tyrosine-type recombinase/integrase [Bdellovibrionota bacterium]